MPEQGRRGSDDGAGQEKDTGAIEASSGCVAPQPEAPAKHAAVTSPDTKDEGDRASTAGPEANPPGDRTQWLPWRIFLWTPKRCRYDPSNPPPFTLGLNILYAFVCAPHPS